MSKESNLETFTLVWLNVSTEKSFENINVQQCLRTVVDRLKIFQCMNDCEQYIQTAAKEDRIVLVVSGDVTSNLRSQIQQLRQICSVHYYDVNQAHKNELIPEILKVIIIRFEKFCKNYTVDHSEDTLYLKEQFFRCVKTTFCENKNILPILSYGILVHKCRI